MTQTGEYATSLVNRRVSYKNYRYFVEGSSDEDFTFIKDVVLDIDA